MRTGIRSRSWRPTLVLAWLSAPAPGVFLACSGLLEQETDDFRGWFSDLPEAAPLDPEAFLASIWTLAFQKIQINP